MSDQDVRRLLELLDLERLDEDLFRGRQPDTTRQRVFGGQVAGQALIAASRTVAADHHVHSLHSYFLLAGDYTVPIIYDVERLRDGRSFSTRRVVARQHGRAIYYQTVSFQGVEEGYEHQDSMPDVPGPEKGMDFFEILKRRDNPESDALAHEWAALEARHLGTSAIGLEQDPAHPAQARVWMRMTGSAGDDPIDHAAAFTYASDATLLGAALAAHPDAHPTKTMMASLDHTIWFHRPFAVDEWWLYDQWSPSASGGRGLSIGRVFRPDGVLVATVAQEGLIRPARD